LRDLKMCHRSTYMRTLGKARGSARQDMESARCSRWLVSGRPGRGSRAGAPRAVCGFPDRERRSGIAGLDTRRLDAFCVRRVAERRAASRLGRRRARVAGACAFPGARRMDLAKVVSTSAP